MRGLEFEVLEIWLSDTPTAVAELQISTTSQHTDKLSFSLPCLACVNFASRAIYALVAASKLFPASTTKIAILLRL